ncbi:MAG TPA: TetR/AcrR family transcriptional regulator [Anaerolineales bacterium]|nr:TetR/AcrR family transcriptional regulator [Anaerolineales bacterium]
MSAKRRERQREETTQEIIATARRQIAEQGASALSLRGIARQMEMTTPALYRYFENRDALVTALIVKAYQSLQEHLEAARIAHRAENPAEQVIAVGLAYREWALKYPEDYALIFGTPIPGYKAPAESTLPLARSALGVLIRVLEDGWKSGDFHLPDDPPILSAELLSENPNGAELAPLLSTALALWSQVHGLTSLELFNHFAPMLQDPAELFRMELTNRLQILLKEDD